MVIFHRFLYVYQRVCEKFQKASHVLVWPHGLDGTMWNDPRYFSQSGTLEESCNVGNQLYSLWGLPNINTSLYIYIYIYIYMDESWWVQWDLVVIWWDHLMGFRLDEFHAATSSAAKLLRWNRKMDRIWVGWMTYGGFRTLFCYPQSSSIFVWDFPL